MTGKTKIGFGKGEYMIMNLIISLTMIVWFITWMMYANIIDPGMVRIVVASFIMGGAVIMLFIIYVWINNKRNKKVNAGLEYQDERSDQCSMKATRNAFVVALLILSVYMILGQLKPDSLYEIQALQAVFGVTVAAYAASYYIYKRA
ncbi:MAG TPA: hypothetical protein VK436_17265 [Methanocella sp.]|nr:hypothetical protein [Methanocella sp.]